MAIAAIKTQRVARAAARRALAADLVRLGGGGGAGGVGAGYAWGVWPLITGGAVAAALFVPAMRWQREPARVTAGAKEREAAAAQIGAVAEAVKRGVSDPRVREASAEQVRALEE